VGLAWATIAAMSLLVALSDLGLGFGLIRFLSQAGKDANAMVNSSFTIAGLVSLIFGGIFIAGLDFWSPPLLILRENSIYLAAFISFTMLATISQLMDATFIARRRAGFALLRGLIFGVSRLPIPFLLAVFFHSFGIFASWGISLAVALLFSAFLFLSRVQPGYRAFPSLGRGVVNRLVRFSLANYIANLFWLAPVHILPIMVLNSLGGELNAHFSVAWFVGILLVVPALAFSVSLFAEGSSDEQSLVSVTRSSLKLTFLILVPAVILVLAVADKLLLLFGSSYSESGTTLLRILALSALPIGINYIYLSMKRVEMKLALIIGLSAFIAVATLGLSYMLLPRMGISGVGIAWLSSHGVVAIGIAISFLLR
jgi:O-antigen/teichoic acid export membrane protein